MECLALDASETVAERQSLHGIQIQIGFQIGLPIRIDEHFGIGIEIRVHIHIHIHL